MALWIEAKYAGIVGTRLRNFKPTGQHKWAFSCPICGDSRTNKRKARGGFYPKKGELNFGCFNGCEGKSFSNFLKDFDPVLYDEFRKECLMDRGPQPEAGLPLPPKASEPINFTTLRWADGLEPISTLPDDHPARKFVLDRLVPEHWYSHLFFCRRWFEWCHRLDPSKHVTDRDQERLVIAALDYRLEPIGFQGRSLDGIGQKYMTVVLRRDIPMVFGLDRGELISYALEGPFDAMFLPRAIASCGGDIASDIEQLVTPGMDRTKLTIVYDNEKRSVHTVKKMLKAAEAGYSVCVWPDPLRFKDVNDMVLELVRAHGITVESAALKVQKIIDAHSYSGTRATLAINRWRKI